MDSNQSLKKIKEIIDVISIPQEGDTIYLFGGGLFGDLAASILKDEMQIKAIFDNSSKKQGTVIEGLPCISPQELTRCQNLFVLVSTVKYYKAIHQQLEDMGIRHCCLDAYVAREHFDEIETVYSLLDDASREVYAGVLFCRVSGDLSGIEQYCCENQYFCLPQFRYIHNERGAFIDCGAYVGDSLEKMVKYSLGTAPAIYAFEPGDRTFAALQKRASFLCDMWAIDPRQIICEKKGVGEKDEFLSFRADSVTLCDQSLTHDADDSEGIPVIGLDSYLSQKQEQDVSFIKVDIEGWEYGMLHGAKDTIRRCKPKLAISIYHSIFDFFRLPLYLKDLVPEYQFQIRHHTNRDEDTVLYCHI